MSETKSVQPYAVVRNLHTGDPVGIIPFDATTYDNRPQEDNWDHYAATAIRRARNSYELARTIYRDCVISEVPAGQKGISLVVYKDDVTYKLVGADTMYTIPKGR